MTLSSIEGPQPIHTTPPAHVKDADLERLQLEEQVAVKKGSVIKGLGWLDRFLAVWILLAMVYWRSPGNLRRTNRAGTSEGQVRRCFHPHSSGLARHDVSDSLQSPL